VLIPAGKFKRGSNKNPIDPSGNATVKQPPENEVPQHEVVITKPYYMGRYEVTQEQWFEIMGKNPSAHKGRKLPVENISWEDCQEFIKKLNAKTKGGYKLPTESEWEYACRAGTSTAYSFGESITIDDANINGSNIKAVGSYNPNAFGLYDMHGNALEWCEDWLGKYPAGSVADPSGPTKGRSRVMRGGSFSVNGSRSGSADRGADFNPSTRLSTGGLRLARTP